MFSCSYADIQTIYIIITLSNRSLKVTKDMTINGANDNEVDHDTKMLHRNNAEILGRSHDIHEEEVMVENRNHNNEHHNDSSKMTIMKTPHERHRLVDLNPLWGRRASSPKQRNDQHHDFSPHLDHTYDTKGDHQKFASTKEDTHDEEEKITSTRSLQEKEDIKRSQHEYAEKSKNFYLDKTAKMIQRVSSSMQNKKNNGNHINKINKDLGVLHSGYHSDQLKNIRKSPTRKSVGSSSLLRSPLLRHVAEGIPEVHFIGEIRKGYGLNNYPTSSSISCKWKIEWGRSFSNLAGETNGQSQYSMVIDHNDSKQQQQCLWNHPIDVHFATSSMQGWPRISVQLWELDVYGRAIFAGFGFAHLPCAKGE